MSAVRRFTLHPGQAPLPPDAHWGDTPNDNKPVVHCRPGDEETRAWAMFGLHRSWLTQMLDMAARDFARCHLNREIRERITRQLEDHAAKLWPDDLVVFEWSADRGDSPAGTAEHESR